MRRYLPVIGAGVLALIILVAFFPLMMADIQLQRGRAAAAEGERERAVDLLQSALVWDDDNPETYRELGDVYLRASQAEMAAFLRQNRTRKVIRSLPPARPGQGIVDPKVQVRDLNTGDVRSRIRKGDGPDITYTEEVVYILPAYRGSPEGYEAKAVDAYRRAIKLNPLDPRLYHGLAEVMQFAAPFEQTDAVFRKAVELDPNNPNIHHSRALFCLRTGHRDQALLALRSAIAIFPVGAHSAFSAWLDNGGTIDQLKALAGTSPTALARLGSFFEGRQEGARARDAYMAACSSVGGNADCRAVQEEPPARLLPLLLAKLEHYGYVEEHAYYAQLWSLDPADGARQ